MYKYLFEFLGMIFFTYVIIFTGNPLLIGLSLSLLILTTNGYFNPAVIIAMATNNKIKINEILPYIIAEILGALVALELHKRYTINMKFPSLIN